MQDYRLLKHCIPEFNEEIAGIVVPEMESPRRDEYEAKISHLANIF